MRRVAVLTLSRFMEDMILIQVSFTALDKELLEVSRLDSFPALVVRAF